LGKGETISAVRYVQTPNKLRRALREECPKKTVILQRDNARPHTARLTLQTIQKNDRELLSRPSYNPDLAPSDYHLFRSLKNHVRGHNYGTDEAVRKPCEAGSEELERASAAEAFLRFFSADRNA
jgi:histone-lysine N-methyltransferase SETMAR